MTIDLTQTEINLQEAKLYEIATIVKLDWENVYFGAVPYLEALGCLTDIGDAYGADSGDSIVIYFLTNARAWRGETAKAVKAELKSRYAAAQAARR